MGAHRLQSLEGEVKSTSAQKAPDRSPGLSDPLSEPSNTDLYGHLYSARPCCAYRPRRGLSIPSITVLDPGGRVIEEEQRRVFRFNAQSGYGADIIFAAGTTGEWNRISNDQRQRLIEIEVDEVRRVNQEIAARGLTPVEAWAGVTAPRRAETIENLNYAATVGADAAVIAPLSIHGLPDMVSFFQRDVSDLFDRLGKSLPIYLYDNADIAADPRVPHIKTRDVKRLSRLQFISGVKVSAPRRVLGNYTKGALHFKDKGEFGVYIGDAMLIFQVFRMEQGLIGTAREYWNRYLLHNELPIGVVAGPANALPREWQRAWRACYAGDDRLIAAYRPAFERFTSACSFLSGGKPTDKTIACLKLALQIEGVIDTRGVAPGTPCLTEPEAQRFAESFSEIKDDLARLTDPIWISSANKD
jgi:dihydrodipicolinate synthase/N-acetylneuraminate lyase